MEGGIRAVDLFCGAGGLTRGLLDAGIDVLSGYDIDENCRYPYEVNNAVDFHKVDIRDVTSTQIRKILGRRGMTLIAGCAPCQPFSLLGRNAADDEGRQHLLSEFARVVYGVAPTFVAMENVPGLCRNNVFKQVLEKLQLRGYHVDYRVVNAEDYGVPQRRRRLVLVASRIGPLKVPQPNIRRVRTVRDAIGDLGRVKAGFSHRKDPTHRASRLSDLNLRRIKASRPGGTWEDWPEDIRLDCHVKKSGKEYIHPYGRMSWRSPSPTITTHFYNLGSGRFGHPTQARAITPREAALLQTFPRNYQFIAPNQELQVTKIGPLIGNAVPVRLAKAIGLAIATHAEVHRVPLCRGRNDSAPLISTNPI